MNTLRSFFANAILSIKDKFTTDTDELIIKLHKLEAKIEAAIAKDTRKAQQLTIAAANLNAALKANDTKLNAAYKLLHNVSELTK